MTKKADKSKTEANQAEQVDIAAEEAESAAEAVVEEAEFNLEELVAGYKQLETEAAAAKAAAEDAEARLLRLQADFDNFRRRQREESERNAAQAGANIVEALLPVLDNFERALASMEENAAKEGVQMISKQLFEQLANAGLELMQAQGELFDPNIHQAVAQIPCEEGDKNKVIAVLQNGYSYNGKLLRAAMVQVGV